MIWVYKDGLKRGVNGAMWPEWRDKGWSMDKPDEPEIPTLDFSPYDNAKLLHIAAVANVEVPPNASRAELEEALTAMWEGLGCPSAWLKNAADAPAPVPAAEMPIPPINDPRDPVTPEEFANGLFGGDET